VTVDVSASSEDEAKEIAIQMAKANEIESDHYNLDGLHAQGAEVIHSDSFDGELPPIRRGMFQMRSTTNRYRLNQR